MADDAELQVSPEETPVDNTADSQPEEQSQAAAPEVSQETIEQPAEVAQPSEPKVGTPSNQEKVDSKPTQPTQPMSRRSAAYRIQQLVEENKTLKQQAKPAPATDEWDAPAEEETQPDIAALIAQEVEKRLHPVISESTKNADDSEINELFSGDKTPERTAYENKIREMWKLPQYKDVAAQELYKIAKFDELSGSMDIVKQQAIEEYKKAEKEAKESSASGTSNTSNRTGESGKSIADMSDEEFIAHNERVKLGFTK